MYVTNTIQALYSMHDCLNVQILLDNCDSLAQLQMVYE